MKLYVSLVLTLALLMVNGTTARKGVVARKLLARNLVARNLLARNLAARGLEDEQEENNDDQVANNMEFGIENALRVFIVETQKCMVSADPQGCEFEKAQTLCWNIAEHVPEQEQGGDPCACFDTNESVAFALNCIGADFNDFCSDHPDAQRCKTPALWLLTGVIAGLNDLDVPTEQGKLFHNKMQVREPVKENERMLYNKMPVREPVKAI